MQRESSGHPVPGTTGTQAQLQAWPSWWHCVGLHGHPVTLPHCSALLLPDQNLRCCASYYKDILLTSLLSWVYSFESLLSLLLAVMLGSLTAMYKEILCKKQLCKLGQWRDGGILICKITTLNLLTKSCQKAVTNSQQAVRRATGTGMQFIHD